jgi:glucose-1-phosphate cytidylyltransferase
VAIDALFQPLNPYYSVKSVKKWVKVQAVILAGGLGTRLREETEYKPKPMVEIGGRPILWHLMKNLASHQIYDFIICLGYKGDLIKDYFLNYESRTNDITISLQNQGVQISHENSHNEPWNVTLANTGQSTMTGGRIFKIRDYIKGSHFLCTYGDGLANVDIPKLIDFHHHHGKIATVTAVKPPSRFGALAIDENSKVTSFTEKPISRDSINGGFFIFSRKIFDYLDDGCTLEAEPLEKLASEGNLMAFNHDGYWQPMDTYRESQELNSLWNNGRAPWKNW